MLTFDGALPGRPIQFLPEALGSSITFKKKTAQCSDGYCRNEFFVIPGEDTKNNFARLCKGKAPHEFFNKLIVVNDRCRICVLVCPFRFQSAGSFSVG